MHGGWHICRDAMPTGLSGDRDASQTRPHNQGTLAKYHIWDDINYRCVYVSLTPRTQTVTGFTPIFVRMRDFHCGRNTIHIPPKPCDMIPGKLPKDPVRPLIASAQRVCPKRVRVCVCGAAYRCGTISLTLCGTERL